MASGSADNHPGGLLLGGGTQQGTPLPELAEQLGQPSPHAQWPGDELEPALGPEGTAELTPAMTAAEHAAAGGAAYRPRYSASAAEGYPGGAR